ncbi:hypothetical protein CAPTEDRAFT_219680 [Capitella teleta]|uniref:Uncharacterized protein n=1 Tax=Capitella teleta TaxID=283909 RepID=R7UCV3_CAPTE|nr:hypothetical protein CAPTEDRAFT_219680 [Capitella teleta]|eukprot:ELU01087.1 hypothetical protein CAPTEDRAFT_219680 [Capitella teleta]
MANDTEVDPCPPSLPYAEDYLPVLFAFAALATLIVLCLFLETSFFFWKHLNNWKPRDKAKWLVAVYPVMCITSCVALIVPRASTLNDLVASAGRIQWLETMVLQYALFGPITSYVSAILWANDDFGYKQNAAASGSTWLHSINSATTLLAMYGFQIIYNVSQVPLSRTAVRPKFLCLQLVLFINGIQQSVIKLFVASGLIHCDPPLNPTGVADLIRMTVSEYRRVIRMTVSEYRRVIRMTVSEYRRIIRMTVSECRRVIRMTVSECRRVIRMTVSEYRRIIRMTVSECRRVIRMTVSECRRVIRMTVSEYRRIIRMTVSEYRRVIRMTVSEYRRVIRMTVSEYRRIIRMTVSECRRVIRMTVSECRRVIRMTVSEYRRIIRMTVSEYRRVIRMTVSEYHRVIRMTVSEYRRIIRMTVSECRRVIRMTVSECRRVIRMTVSEYRRIIRMTVSEYRRVIRMTVSEYRRVIRMTVSEYRRIIRMTVSECRRVIRMTVSEYRRVIRMTVSEYRRIIRMTVSECRKVTSMTVSENHRVIRMTVFDYRRVIRMTVSEYRRVIRMTVSEYRYHHLIVIFEMFIINLVARKYYRRHVGNIPPEDAFRADTRDAGAETTNSLLREYPGMSYLPSPSSEGSRRSSVFTVGLPDFKNLFRRSKHPGDSISEASTSKPDSTIDATRSFFERQSMSSTVEMGTDPMVPYADQFRSRSLHKPAEHDAIRTRPEAYSYAGQTNYPVIREQPGRSTTTRTKVDSETTFEGASDVDEPVIDPSKIKLSIRDSTAV